MSPSKTYSCSFSCLSILAQTKISFEDNFTRSFEIFGTGDSTITANKEALFSYEHLEKKCEQLNNLIGNTIHCTAEYNDGTTVEQDIKIGATISTFSEAFPDEYNAMPEDDRPEKDYCDVFVTFTAVE